MTSTTETLSPARDAAAPRSDGRWMRLARFLLAFVLGLLAALAVGAGALYAFGAAYAGRVLPGVHVGSVDLGGLDRVAAEQRLSAVYGSFSDGTVVLDGPLGSVTIPYSEIGRRPDVSGMVDEALAVGRAGNPIERAVGETQTALHGAAVAPRVDLDAARLSTRVAAAIAPLQVAPVDASIRMTNTGPLTTPAVVGRAVDTTTLSAELAAALASPGTGEAVRVAIPVVARPPAIDDADVAAARAEADRAVGNVVLRGGDERWTIDAVTVRSWIRFSPTQDGRVETTIDPRAARSAIKTIAPDAAREPRNASFVLGKRGRVVDVRDGSNGRTLDVPGTTALVLAALETRRAGGVATAVDAKFRVQEPGLTTGEARQVASRMRRISSWTTYFPIKDANGFGANIWIPTEIINGTVVAPGELFDFWKAVGPVTRERGFRQGGAILNGHTEPQGALAGGICSCSTTLFNAALRAGFEIHARRNHYYYIDRYPLGLDATVFIGSDGYRQTMSWRNDTQYPVLIRGYRIRKGMSGYVRFDLYSVRNERKVVIAPPIVQNVTQATDTTQRTASLPRGQTKRVEYPVDGKDVWRTVTVYEHGKVIHRYTFHSHYARITGVVLVGTGAGSP